VFLFGSYATETQTPRSDIDVAFYFQNASEEKKMEIEQKISLLFDEPVHILRLEDEEISPVVRLATVSGIPVIPPDIDKLNSFVLSIIHRAHECKLLMDRLKKAA